MKATAVLGLSQLSACGVGRAALRRALEGSIPEPEWLAVSREPGAEVAPVLRVRAGGLDEAISPRAVRRLDDFAKHFIYAAQLAVDDAGIEMPPPERVAVVTGTGYASLVTSFALLDDIITGGDDAGSPFKFTTAVNNASASSVATFLDARGPCLAVLGFNQVLASVLTVASRWLEEDRADLVIAGAGDEYHPVIGYGLAQMGGWAPDGRIRPLDLGAQSFVPGETFAAMVLARHDQERPGTPVIQSVERFHDLARQYSPEPGVPQLLAADGRTEAAEGYAAVMAGGAPVVAHGDLWGGNPSAEALNLVTAALLLERGRFFTTSAHESVGVNLPEPDSLLDSSRVACVAANPDGSGSVVILGR